ncbi:MAG: YHS domain-containing protein [Actinomycetota bacterium]
MELDPVCGMEVDPATAEFTTEHDGRTYSFCAKGCLDDFLEDPNAFLG